jgi:hypothetical protein
MIKIMDTEEFRTARLCYLYLEEFFNHSDLKIRMIVFYVLFVKYNSIIIKEVVVVAIVALYWLIIQLLLLLTTTIFPCLRR